MSEYSLAVALFDYLPVLISVLGLAALSRGMRTAIGQLASLAWLATAAVATGGLCKASWKLLIALGNPAIDWLENMLFIAMAPGFVLMACLLSHTRRVWLHQHPANALPIARVLLWVALAPVGAISIATAWPDSRAWFFWLLAMTTAGNAALLLQASLAARQSGLGWSVVAGLGYAFLASLALGGLARLPDSNTTAWIQEGVNLSAQTALALSLFVLSRRMRGTLHSATPATTGALS